MRRTMKHDATGPRLKPRHHSPGTRLDHGRLRHFDHQKPLRRKRGPARSDAPLRLPCGGEIRGFVGPGKGRTTSPARMPHLITDKRHFAGEKAADTRLRNKVHGLLDRVGNAVRGGHDAPSSWPEKAALDQLRELREFLDRWFGWEGK